MKTVLITGTSKGIGFSAALAFARAGHQVAATMRNPNGAPALAEIAVRENLPITIFAMDVNHDLSVQEACTQINKQFGAIDVLVNNAGIEGLGSVEEFPIEGFRAVMETNYFGVIRCIQAVLPSMRQSRSGCIINISSVAGRLASGSMSPYSATKFALESLSEILAQEVKAVGVRVAIVEPGIIDTQMSRHITAIPGASPYSHQRRLSAIFTASLTRPVSPTLVADKLLEIATGDSWQLRYPVGPDAAPFLGWRQSMSDEVWVELAGLSDEAWCDRIEKELGMDLRSMVLGATAAELHPH